MGSKISNIIEVKIYYIRLRVSIACVDRYVSNKTPISAVLSWYLDANVESLTLLSGFLSVRTPSFITNT